MVVDDDEGMVFDILVHLIKGHQRYKPSAGACRMILRRQVVSRTRCISREVLWMPQAESAQVIAVAVMWPSRIPCAWMHGNSARRAGRAHLPSGELDGLHNMCHQGRPRRDVSRAKWSALCWLFADAIHVTMARMTTMIANYQ